MQPFKVGFFSFSQWPWRPIQVAVYLRSCFSAVWIFHSLATYLSFMWKDICPVWGHYEESCHDLPHTGFCVNTVCISLGYIPRTEVPGFYGKHTTSFTRISLFPRVALHFKFPPAW